MPSTLSDDVEKEVWKVREVKIKLPAGVWQDEPDEARWNRLDFRCKVVRSGTGAWCGYVGVPVTSPVANKLYMGMPVKVHGGITYSSNDEPGRFVRERPNSFKWVGFDCAHCFDRLPGGSISSQTYRDFTYVVKETIELAKQIELLEEKATEDDAIEVGYKLLLEGNSICRTFGCDWAGEEGCKKYSTSALCPASLIRDISSNEAFLYPSLTKLSRNHVLAARTIVKSFPIQPRRA